MFYFGFFLFSMVNIFKTPMIDYILNKPQQIISNILQRMDPKAVMCDIGRI